MPIADQPIGVIRTRFAETGEMPRNTADARGTAARVLLDAPYTAGLESIDGFSHLILVFRFHRSEGFDLHVRAAERPRAARRVRHALAAPCDEPPCPLRE